MSDDRKPSRITNPDTGQPEDPFRTLVRDVLCLDWSTRDAAIFAELKRLKAVDEATMTRCHCINNECPIHGGK